MTPEERSALAQAYIEHLSDPVVRDAGNVFSKRDNSSTEWAIDKVLDLTYRNPEKLWELILEILHRDPPDEVIGNLAAGPLEDYLAKCGERVIERIEQQAAKDPKFKSLLGGVWQNTMTAEVWARVQACWDRSRWDNGA